MLLRYPHAMHWSLYLMAALPLVAGAQPPAPASDEACRKEAARVTQRCDAESLKQCQRQRLSSRCLKDVESAGGPKQAACKKELQQTRAPCQEDSKECVDRTLSPGCKERLAALERRRKACDDEVQRVWRQCKAEPRKEKQAECFERNRAAASAACQ